jgi:hypothetical protein
VTETTPANQITGDVVPDTMHTGSTDPFECIVEYLHDKSRSPRRQLARFMARTQEVEVA